MPPVPALLPPRAEMLAAVRRRDARYEGVFVLAVRTTGVACRPGCPARAPRPENLEFFPDLQAAEAAGFRPCRRCRPERAAGAAPPWMAELERELELRPQRALSDADLVARGLEPRRVRRAWLARTGTTFHAWQRARRLGLAHEALRAGRDGDEAGFDAGYASASGFREAFAKLFGAPPARAARTQRLLRARLLPSPLGPILAAASDQGLCLLEFADRKGLPGQARSLLRWHQAAVVPGQHAHLSQLERELERYFEGRLARFDVPLDLRGPPFHVQVWRALLAIPPGETRGYAELARALGRPDAQRAVASANGCNRISVVVPCHRVIGSDGRLVGYGGGLWRKRRLLELEGAALTASGRPTRG
jgi:AraC family transcriptional regulator of adaptative response/methylated-DNA-[protein]-cysteine methyltransferase